MDYLQYQTHRDLLGSLALSFKPYYKWITFNTKLKSTKLNLKFFIVLNLIINGLPSIQKLRL